MKLLKKESNFAVKYFNEQSVLVNADLKHEMKLIFSPFFLLFLANASAEVYITMDISFRIFKITQKF